MGGFSNLGSVYVEVGADLSKLSGALQGAVADAAQAGEQIGAGIESGLAASGSGLQNLEQEIQSVGPALSELGTGFAELGKGMVIGGAALTVISEGLASIVEESINFSGKIQFATAALTTFFGSAQQSAEVLERIKGIEQSSIFSFPQLAGAAQQLAALGVSAEKIPATLNAITLAAEAVGGSTASLDQATTAIARIQATGQISQRALLQLGLSWADLAKTMGTSAEEAKAELTKGFGDADQLVGIVTTSITAKTKEMAGAIATTIPVALNQLKGAWDEDLGKLGQSLGPVVVEVMAMLKGILDQVGQLIDLFSLLPTPVKDTAIVLGGLALAIGPVTLAIGAFVFAAGEVLESIPKITDAFLKLRGAAVATEVTEGATAVAEVGTAATASAGAMTGLAASAATAATALGGLIALGLGAIVGAWVGNLESVRNAFDHITESIPGLETAIQHITGAFNALKQAQDDQAFSVQMMEQRLAALGIAIDKTGLSADQYAQKLRDAIKSQSDFNASVDDGGTHFSNGAEAIITSTQQLQVNLQKAKEVLVELTAAYKDNEVGSDAVTAAQKKVTEALSALGDKSAEAAKQATELAKEQSKIVVELDDLYLKTPVTAAAMEAAFKKGFNTQGAIDNIQKLIDKINEMPNAGTGAFKVYADMLTDLQQRVVTLADAETKRAGQLALQATQTQRVIDVTTQLDRVQQGLSGTMQNGVQVLSTGAKIFDVMTAAGDGTVQMIVGRASPAFVSLADAAAKAGMSVEDFSAKTQEARLNSLAAMGDIGAASDSMVLKIKAGQDDAVKALQAALGAYSALRDEVDRGTASEAELARAIQMVQQAARTADISMADIGSTAALSADEQQKLADALAATGNGYRDVASAAASAGAAMASAGQAALGSAAAMTANFNASSAAELKSTDLASYLMQTLAMVEDPAFGPALGNVNAQSIKNTLEKLGYTASGDNITAGQSSFSVGGATSPNGTKAATTANTQAAANANVATAAKTATDTTVNFQASLTSLAAQMQAGWDQATQLGDAMDALSRQGLQNTDQYRQMADQLNGIYDLNGKLNDQYTGIQAQLGTAVTGLNTFGSTVTSVSGTITAATTAATKGVAGFASLGAILGMNSGSSSSGSGASAGTVDLGQMVNINGTLQPNPNAYQTISPPTQAMPTPADFVTAISKAKWSVNLDGKELSGSFVQFFEDNGLVVPRH